MSNNINDIKIQVGDYVRRKPNRQTGVWTYGDILVKVNYADTCDIGLETMTGDPIGTNTSLWNRACFDKVDMLEIEISVNTAETYLKDWPNSKWLGPALEAFKAEHKSDDREVPFIATFDELKDLGNAYVRKIILDTDDVVDFGFTCYAFQYADGDEWATPTNKFLVTKLPTNKTPDTFTFKIPVDEARRINSNAGSCVLNVALQKYDEGDLRAKFNAFIATVKLGDVIQFEDDKGHLSDAFFLSAREGWYRLGNLGATCLKVEIDIISGQYLNYNAKINHLKGANHQ